MQVQVKCFEEPMLEHILALRRGGNEGKSLRPRADAAASSSGTARAKYDVSDNRCMQNFKNITSNAESVMNTYSGDLDVKVAAAMLGSEGVNRCRLASLTECLTKVFRRQTLLIICPCITLRPGW